MAAKKKAASKMTPVEEAAAAIQRRYGNSVGGAKTLRQAVQSLQDVVAESSLTDKFSMRTLDAAATRVAQNAFNGMKRADKYGRGKK